MRIYISSIIALGFVLLFYYGYAYGQNYDDILTVVFIDLGREGDSTLVVFPNGNTMLIDGGLKFSTPFERVKNVLEENDIQRINLMIASHADADHIGGLAKLLAEDSQYYNMVDEIWANSLPGTSDIYDEFIDNIDKQDNIEYLNVITPMSTGIGDPITVQLLSPPDEAISSHSDHASESNSNSLVTRMEYGDVSFLFTADTTWTTEEWLVENKPNLIDVDIMNAPHHGSKYASGYRDTGFIDSTSPKFVIFSADADNRYKHPHDEIIERYETAGINTLQTGNVGNIVIKTDGVGCSLILQDQQEQPCYDGIDLVSSQEPVVEETIVEELVVEETIVEEPNGCLIATATYGSEFAIQVQQLRELRDNSLLQTNSGTTFMSGFNALYYSFSPTIADWERQNPAFKEVVKITITPLLTSLSILNYVDIDSEAEMLGYGIGVILLNVGMYFVVPVMIILQIRKKLS